MSLWLLNKFFRFLFAYFKQLVRLSPFICPSSTRHPSLPPSSSFSSSIHLFILFLSHCIFIWLPIGLWLWGSQRLMKCINRKPPTRKRERERGKGRCDENAKCFVLNIISVKQTSKSVTLSRGGVAGRHRLKVYDKLLGENELHMEKRATTTIKTSTTTTRATASHYELFLIALQKRIRRHQKNRGQQHSKQKLWKMKEKQKLKKEKN